MQDKQTDPEVCVDVVTRRGGTLVTLRVTLVVALAAALLVGLLGFGRPSAVPAESAVLVLALGLLVNTVVLLALLASLRSGPARAMERPRLLVSRTRTVQETLVPLPGRMSAEPAADPWAEPLAAPSPTAAPAAIRAFGTGDIRLQGGLEDPAATPSASAHADQQAHGGGEGVSGTAEEGWESMEEAGWESTQEAGWEPVEESGWEPVPEDPEATDEDDTSSHDAQNPWADAASPVHDAQNPWADANEPAPHAEVTPEVQEAPATVEGAPVPIQDIGLDPDGLGRLEAAGLTTITQVVQLPLEELARVLGANAAEAQAVQAQADLVQVPGIGPREARLLVEIGVRGVAELRRMDGATLMAALANHAAGEAAEGIDQETVDAWLDAAWSVEEPAVSWAS